MPVVTIRTPNTSVTSSPGTYLFTNTIISSGGFNYISIEDGANNALHGTLNSAGGTAVSVVDGLGIRIKLAHTLQNGSNTFNLNAHGNDSIVKQSGGANATNMTAVASGAILDMVFDGTRWQVVGY